MESSINSGFDYWGLLAGVALFLFAMSQLETSLKTLGGRKLAVYLREHSNNPFKAVFGGLLSTAILQSSSVVGLMVLAFTGSGLLSLTSALGIVFGSNLGTTLTGWIVATAGFKFDIFEFSLPMIALGGLTYLFSTARWAEYGRTLLSLGLLLLGLQLMKTSVMSVEQLIDINDLADLAPWQYLLFGTVVAAIIQSSSATMMITLTALYSGIVSLPNAAAIAIGADLGTTTTLIIGAIKGSHIKQQVAAGQIIFNVVTDIIAFALRVPLLGVIAFIGIEDPLYSLVAFHSLFNLMGLCLFLPLTGPFARQLQRLIPAPDNREASYLTEVGDSVNEAALEAIERETSMLIARVCRLQALVFEPPLHTPQGTSPVPHQLRMQAQHNRPFKELYTATKKLEGELMQFTIRLQAGPMDTSDSQRLSQLLNAAREAMHSAKAIKDIRHNLIDFAQPGNAVAERYSAIFRESMQRFLDQLWQFRQCDTDSISFEDLATAITIAHRSHDELHDTIYTDMRQQQLAQIQVSSLLNVNRELLNTHRALLLALGDYYLDAGSQENLERAPF